MSIQDISSEKLALIEWISQLNDYAVIQQIQNLKSGTYNVPSWQKDEVKEELAKYAKGETKGKNLSTILDELRTKNT